MAGPQHEWSEEQVARCVVRDLEPHLRRQFALEALSPDFVAELYTHVLDELRTPSPQKELVSSLALTAYFVTASQQPGGQIAPDLIPRLRKVIACTFETMRSSTSVAPLSDRKEAGLD